MYVFPVLRWLKVFSQTWEGDVTMVLPSSFMQLKKSVTNPSNQDLLDACKQVCSIILAYLQVTTNFAVMQVRCHSTLHAAGLQPHAMRSLHPTPAPGCHSCKAVPAPGVHMPPWVSQPMSSA